jgi:AcrR family transcriptional regulator
MAQASVYSHFTDLDDLVLHVLQLRYDELAARMRAAAANGHPVGRPSRPVHRLHRLGHRQFPATTAWCSAAAPHRTPKPTAQAPNSSPT